MRSSTVDACKSRTDSCVDKLWKRCQAFRSRGRPCSLTSLVQVRWIRVLIHDLWLIWHPDICRATLWSPCGYGMAVLVFHCGLWSIQVRGGMETVCYQWVLTKKAGGHDIDGVDSHWSGQHWGKPYKPDAQISRMTEIIALKIPTS